MVHDVDIAKWLFNHFVGCEAPWNIVEVATEGGHLDVLKVLWEHRSVQKDESDKTKVFDVFEDGESTVKFRSWFSLENLGRVAITAAGKKRKLAQFMEEGRVLGDADRDIAIEQALKVGDLKLVKVLVPESKHILEYADYYLHPDVLTFLLASGCLQFAEHHAASAIVSFARDGNLDSVQQVYQLHSPLQKSHEHWQIAWRNALKAACSNGDLPMLRWLMSHYLGREVAEKLKQEYKGRDFVLFTPLYLATSSGHVEVAQILYDEGLVDPKDCSLVLDATRAGHLGSVAWIAEHNLLREQRAFSRAIEIAAKRGHLDILQFLHSLTEPSRSCDVEEKGSQEDQGFSFSTSSSFKDVLRYAAKSGNVAMLEWLNRNYPTRCKPNAINAAAAAGQLDAVKWFHTNWPNYFGDAMGHTVGRGHFTLVKWLCENCSTLNIPSSIVMALQHGHVRIAFWLQQKYHICTLSGSYSSDLCLVTGSCLFGNPVESLLFLQEFFLITFTPQFRHAVEKKYAIGNSTSYTADMILSWVAANYPSTEIANGFRGGVDKLLDKHS